MSEKENADEVKVIAESTAGFRILGDGSLHIKNDGGQFVTLNLTEQALLRVFLDALAGRTRSSIFADASQI